MPNPISGLSFDLPTVNTAAEGEAPPAAARGTASQRPAGEPPVIYRRPRKSRTVETMDLAQRNATQMGPYRIAAFDSSNGGLIATPNIVAELNRIFGPDVQMIPVLDHGNKPYGPKAESEIIRLVGDGLKLAKDIGADAVVMVCNTACTSFKLKAEDKHKIDVEDKNRKARAGEDGEIPILDLIANTAKNIARYGGPHPVVLSTVATAKDTTYLKMIGTEAKKLIEARKAIEEGKLLEAGKSLDSPKLIDIGRSMEARKLIEAGQLLDTDVLKEVRRMQDAGDTAGARAMIADHVKDKAESLRSTDSPERAIALLDMAELIVAGAGLRGGKLLDAFMPGQAGEAEQNSLLEARKMIDARESIATGKGTGDGDSERMIDALVESRTSAEQDRLAKAVKLVDADTVAGRNMNRADRAPMRHADKLAAAARLIAAEDAVKAKNLALKLARAGSLVDAELQQIGDLGQAPTVTRIGAGPQEGQTGWDWATLINERMHLSKDPGQQNLVTQEIRKYVDAIPADASSVYLCCTHFPAFKDRIEAMLKERNLPHIKVVDPIAVQAKALVHALLEGPGIDRRNRPGNTDPVVVSSESKKEERALKASVDSLLRLPYTGIILGHKFNEHFPLHKVNALLESGLAKPASAQSRDELTDDLSRFSDELDTKLSHGEFPARSLEDLKVLVLRNAEKTREI